MCLPYSLLYNRLIPGTIKIALTLGKTKGAVHFVCIFSPKCTEMTMFSQRETSSEENYPQSYWLGQLVLVVRLPLFLHDVCTVLFQEHPNR